MLRKTGKWSVLWFAGGLTFVLSLFLMVSPASASFTFDWTSPGVISFMDSDVLPPGTPVPDSPGQDISKVWWGWASNVHYFRMDLAGTPSASDFASQYGVQVDFLSSFGDPLSGIDTQLLGMFDGSTYTHVLKAWNGHMFATVTNPMLSWSGFDFQASGSTLEWKIFGPATIFDWWGTTDKTGIGLMDISSKVTTTPIPSAAWLLGSGVVALIGIRRRKVQRYSFS